MKRIKRIGALLLALCMCMGMCFSSLAAQVETGNGGDGTITINNAKDGETYSVYKMLDLTYDSTNSSYAYTVTSAWSNFFKTGAGASYFDVDANGGITLKTDSEGNPILTDSDMPDLAQAALAYASEEGIDPDVSGTANGGITFTYLTMGWYLVDTSLGSLCSIDTLTTEVTIYEKNSTPDIGGKEVNDAATDDGYVEDDSANVGDTLNFEVFITDVAHASNLVLHDVMTEGLTYTDNVKVYYAVYVPDDPENPDYDGINNWNTVDSAYWTAISGEEITDNDCTLEVSFTDAWLDTLADYTVIKVTYTATVNENAVDETLWDSETNTAHVSFGNSSTSTSKITDTDTVGFELSKVDSTGNQLTGAEFTLYSVYSENGEGNTAVQLVLSDGVYEVATAAQVEAGEYTTTITAGNIEVKGLAEGTYYLVETTAPDGYNLLTNPIVITIKITRDTNGIATGETVTVGEDNDEKEASDGKVEVVNNTGAQLPGTGGIGTTIFYVVGTILVLAAAALVVAKMRLGKTE